MSKHVTNIKEKSDLNEKNINAIKKIDLNQETKILIQQ
jgi:hypothetical protein